MGVSLWFLLRCGGGIIIKLNVGCGDDKREGYINTDKEVDLNKKLPYKNNSIDEIICYHVIEHLDNPEFTLSEFDRILKKGGILRIKLPINLSMFEHKRHYHPSGYFYKLYNEGNFDLLRFYGGNKNKKAFKDTLMRFRNWFNNLFYNEYYWELKKK